VWPECCVCSRMLASNFCLASYLTIKHSAPFFKLFANEAQQRLSTAHRNKATNTVRFSSWISNDLHQLELNQAKAFAFRSKLYELHLITLLFIKSSWCLIPLDQLSFCVFALLHRPTCFRLTAQSKANNTQSKQPCAFQISFCGKSTENSLVILQQKTTQ